MAHLFGLHPWDLDRLDISDFRTYAASADEWKKANAPKG